MTENRFYTSLLVLQLMLACYCFVNGTVTLSPSPAVADQGESFTFTCTYNGNNTVVGFMWLLNGNTLAIVMIPACTTFNPPGPPDTTRYEYACPSSRHSSFTIKRYVNRTNGDTWQCAVAAPGYIFSNNVTIIEQVDVTSISLQSPYGPIIENIAANLTCETSTGRPAANITWYKKSRRGEILVLTNNISLTIEVVGQLEKSTSALSYIPLRTDNGSHIYCNAVNNPRSSPLQSDSFELNILYSPDGPPVIQGFTNGSTYKVIENNQGALSCYIGESNPEASLMWNCFDNGSSTITSEVNTTKTVTWNATRGLDSYCACQSSHPLAENQTVYITVQVLYPPKIKDCKLRYNASSTSVAVNNTIDIKENSSFTLTCEVDGKPAATTSWSGHVFSTSNILVVDEIKRQQSGTYTIFATNRMEPTFGGPATGNDTKSFNFNLLYAPTVRMTDKDIVEGDNLTLPCPVTKGIPTDTRFKWTRDGDNRTWSTQTMYIQNVTKYDDMMYKCTVQNILRPSGNVQELGINSGSFHLNVLYMSTIRSFSVKGALVSMSAVTVNESEDIIFECTVDSNPSSNIDIQYKDKVIFRQNDINTLLYIRSNIACLDAGEYICAARNPHNKGLDSVRHLMVNVHCSPRPLYQRRQTFSSALHTQALLSFTALAYPEPGTNGFVWHKQHSSTWIPLLSNADLRISTSGLQTNLTITNVSKSDFGHYKVTVTNEIGKYEQHLYLTENVIGQTNSQPTLDHNVMIVGISLGLLCASLIGYAVFSTVYFKRKLKGIRLKSNEDPTNQMAYVNHSYGNVYCSEDTSDKTHNDDNMDDSVHQYTDLTQFIRDDQKEAYEEIQKI